MTLSVACTGPPGATIVEPEETEECVGGKAKRAEEEVFWVESEARDCCEFVELAERDSW